MEDTVGFPVLTNDRKSAAVWGRTMVAYQLAIEGMPVCEIARQLLKDHATVIFMRRKMADALALPRAYSDIIEIWDRFQEKIGICSEGKE
jgi:transposase-like protein